MAFANILYELKQTGDRIQELLDVLDSSVNENGELELTAEQIAYLKEAIGVDDSDSVIDDERVSENKTWSSSKISDEIVDAKRYVPVSISVESISPAAVDAKGRFQQEFTITVDSKSTNGAVLIIKSKRPDGEWYDALTDDNLISDTPTPILFMVDKLSDGAKLKFTLSDGITSDELSYSIPLGYHRRCGVAAMPGNGVVTTSWVQNLPLSTEPIHGKGPAFTVNAGAGQYVWFCVYAESPGAGDFKFKDVNGGFVGGFHKHENVSADCPYIVYVSDNPGLGPVTIQPQ